MRLVKMWRNLTEDYKGEFKIFFKVFVHFVVLVFLCEIKMQSSEIVFHAENADYTHGEMLRQGF